MASRKGHLEPHHFLMRDFWHAVIGSFVVGITFLFKGSMINFALKMETVNIVLVMALTFIITTGEIYALSYKFVKHRESRPFYKFWAKRFFAIIISSFIVVYFAIYAYGLNNFLSQYETLKLSVAILLPAASVGAAVEMLKKA